MNTCRESARVPNRLDGTLCVSAAPERCFLSVVVLVDEGEQQVLRNSLFWGLSSDLLLRRCHASWRPGSEEVRHKRQHGSSCKENVSSGYVCWTPVTNVLVFPAGWMACSASRRRRSDVSFRLWFLWARRAPSSRCSPTLCFEVSPVVLLRHCETSWRPGSGEVRHKRRHASFCKQNVSGGYVCGTTVENLLVFPAGLRARSASR